MKDTSAITNWDTITAGEYSVETRVTIDGTVYYGFDGASGLWEIKRTAPLVSGLEVGKCMASGLDLSIVDPQTIGRMAQILVEIRVTDGTLASDWVSNGIYYIDTRSVEGDFIHVTAYDAMLMLEQPFALAGTQGNWPRKDIAVVQSICQRTGIPLDEGTAALLVNQYDVQYPGIQLEDGTPKYNSEGGLSCREVLGYIGAMYGGNWIVSDDGKLKLVQISAAGDTTTLGNDVYELEAAPPFDAISKVSIVIGTDANGVEQSYDAGDDTGMTLTVKCPWGTQAIADALLTLFTGYVYKPYTAKNAVLDPAVELGDAVIIENERYQVLTLETNFDALYTADIGAPWDAEIDHEYPYQDGANREIQREIATKTTLLQVNADSIESRVSDAEGNISTITQTIDNITLSVSSATGADGKTYASITLTVDGRHQTGQILLDGNVNVSGQLSADELYATYGDMADLTVDHLRTSRRIPLYLASDTRDDNFIDIANEDYRLIAGVYDETLAGSYLDENDDEVATVGVTQARNPNGEPLFWDGDPDGVDVVIGANGYPYENGVRIFTTTENTGYPVMVYTYREEVKARFGFRLNPDNNYYEPCWTFGQGDQNGNNIATLWKMSDSLQLGLSDRDGKRVGLTAGYDGYLDLYGLRRPTSIDFSDWDSGLVTEMLDGDVANSFAVEFDSRGRPIKFTSADGHETVVSW